MKKEKLKSLYSSIISFCHTIVSFFCILFFSKHTNVKEGVCFRNETVSILANGPSLKDVLANGNALLTHTDLLVINFFADSLDFFKLKPQYYVLLDPIFFQDDDSLSEHVVSLYDKLKTVDWKMFLYVPNIAFKRLMSTFVQNKNITICKYNTTRIIGFDCFQNWAYKRNFGIPSSRNVIIPAIMLMINVGYKKVFLYGTEFSWTKTMDVDIENGKMYFNDKHFYSKSEIRYFEKGGYKWWLKAIIDMLNATEQLAKYAKYCKVSIINRTKGSFIDAFEYENTDLIKSE